jgi:hypothetical protein
MKTEKPPEHPPVHTTTLPPEDSLIVETCPFTGEVTRVLTRQQKASEDAQRERVRLRSVAEFSASPLYQARAAKDPTYWDNFSVGGIN